ncbi:hypothetical protein HMPREF1624_03335 [Sporothrix schenckii ATCC 58251]|uniref:GID complex catalytic subunit 2 n=1 Tax=Sporothrix schenckii (strain ATCC 58251 / de Perez 2211183) TaxID=1391915 RepID=U7PYH3_SPOS1|nr:hypothetical protein HMPREF1624_03335 [Sporothrix schenckii ATCC 58251]
MADNMPTLRNDLSMVARKARLTSAVEDVDNIIAQLLEAREKIAAEQDPHAASLILTKLQNPIKEGFETVNNDLKAVSKTQKEFGKALDRSFPITPLPTEYDVMQKHPALINRAIAMHLLREGHFDVSRVFMDEARDIAAINGSTAGGADDDQADDDDAGDDASMTNGDVEFDGHGNFTQTESIYLQDKFQRMYSILQDIKAHNLASAIDWARENSEELEERGSNLEFELCKLQFIWLAKSGMHEPRGEYDDSEDDEEDGEGFGHADFADAFEYARTNFHRFSKRHLGQIQRLSAALVFSSNIDESPYAVAFATSTAFADLATSFTREFCSLLGLSAESPLYVAATAGTIALPRLIKFIGATRSKRTEWTTANEMAFETPLPESMTYHPIFVCPVSKEQTTAANPPMILPCGHTLAHDSLRNITKGSKFKCPYCPIEGQIKDARQIIL